MPIYKKISSVWKPMQHIWRKVSGVWQTDIHKVYVKTGGSWQVIHEKHPVPAGLILPSAVSAPTGWSNFTSANGKFIWTTSNSGVSPGTTGAGLGAQVLYTSYSGNHTGGSTLWSSAGGTAGGSGAGSHRHYFTVDYTPPYQDLYLIKAGSGLYTAPANAFAMSFNGEVGYGLYNATGSNLMLRANSGTGTGGASAIGGLNSDTQGSHNHGTASGGASSGKQSSQTSENAGGHNHTNYTVYITNNIYKTKLSFWYHPTTPFDIRSGMIAFWESLTPPAGWVLCDGTNGTPNMHTRSIKIVYSGSEGYEGDGTVTAYGANLSHGNHEHLKTSTPCPSKEYAYHSSNATHPAHTFNNTYVWYPAYYYLAAIMKT